MKKKKLIEVKLSITLDRRPTTEELEGIRKLFPGCIIVSYEKWERETKI